MRDESAGAAELRERGDREIHEISAWILRAGVVASVGVMLCGLALSFWQGVPSVAQMTGRGFSTDYAAVLRAAARGDGVSLIELGILLLVLTPILRVASAFAVFALHERDRLYSLVTFLVLALTLLSLLALR